MQINERAAKKTLLALGAAILAVVYITGLVHATLPTLLLTAIVVITYQFFLSRENDLSTDPSPAMTFCDEVFNADNGTDNCLRRRDTAQKPWRCFSRGI